MKPALNLEREAIVREVIEAIPGTAEAIAKRDRERRAPLIERRKRLLKELAEVSKIEASPAQIATIERRIEALQAEITALYAKRSELTDAYSIAWRRVSSELVQVENEIRATAWRRFDYLVERCNEALSFAIVDVPPGPTMQQVHAQRGNSRGYDFIGENSVLQPDPTLVKLREEWTAKYQPLIDRGDEIRRSISAAIERARIEALDEREACDAVRTAFKAAEEFFIDRRNPGSKTAIRLEM